MLNSLKRHLIDFAIRLRNWFVVTLPLFMLRITDVARRKQNGNLRYLILSCDPMEPTGSMGDMAMLAALMQALVSKQPGAKFTLIGTYAHQLEIAQIGLVEVSPAWVGIKGVLRFDKLLRRHKAFFALGADVMDGKYGASLVCQMISYCNHAANLSIPSTILGFSFNSTPRLPAVYALAKVHSAVNLNVRDASSLARFSTATGRSGVMAADVAFLLKPDDSAVDAVDEWIVKMRRSKHVLVGVNLSAHALQGIRDRTGEAAFINGLAKQLAGLGTDLNIAYLLIPHDYKKRGGDVALLKNLQDSLNSKSYLQSYYVETKSPARIKSLVGRLDLVVTGRMHLAIAALGMGTPTLCMAYQDKFEGLYAHFDLPASELLQADTLQMAELGSCIHEALRRRELTVQKIKGRIPAVIRLAERNLEM